MRLVPIEGRTVEFEPAGEGTHLRYTQ